MKKLILALCLFAGTAHADEWLEMPNNAGGKIILLNSKCSGKETARMVIATTPQGANVNGCWYYFADMIHIVWQGGQTSSFNPTDFTYKQSK